MIKRNFYLKLMLASSMLFAIMLLFMSSKSYADELDEPADEPIDEEYVVVYDYYDHYVTHYINSYSYSTNYYDEMYLLYEGYDDFWEDINNTYSSITVNIELSITRDTSNNSSHGYIAAKNWHTNDNFYDEKCFAIGGGTNYYYFTFICDFDHMSNSLCFCYKSDANTTWIYNSVEITIIYNSYSLNSTGQFTNN